MAQDLLLALHRRGIRLRLIDDRLDVLAPPGSLTPQLREELRLRRDDLIALLRRTGEGEAPPEISPRPEDRHEPFALTDIQHAYWVGRNPAVELGGVSTHFYFELERSGLDPVRLNDSFRKVIERHDMLRAIVQPDGRQRVLETVPPYEIVLADLRGLPAHEQEAAIERTRDEMDHQVLPADRWPLFDIRVSRLDGDLLRLHISLDVLIMDAASLYLMFNDWRRWYENAGWAPEPLPLSYRDYVIAEEESRGGRRHEDAERYWMERLDELPPPPELPLAAQPGQVRDVRFTRRRNRIAREQWQAVKQAAKERGLTPSAVLMTAYSDVLRMWSKNSAFTLNLTLFNRPPVHPRIGEVIGDFTSVTMLAVEGGASRSFTDRARRLQQQLMRDLEHSSFSGVRVLRERSRRLGGGPAATMPVVFTSALVLSSDGDDSTEGMRFFGEFVHALSQTPQVWLDHQVTEERGDLHVDWDAVEELFPTGLLDDMFAGYQDILLRLSEDQSAWDGAAMPIPLPAWQDDERRRANDTAAPFPAGTLCEVVAEQADRSPEAVAVSAEDGEYSYRELLEQARRVAHRLAGLGALPNTLVGVVLDKCRDQVAAVHGVVGSGSAYLPIDPAWPETRRTDLLRQGQVRFVVTTPNLRDELAWPPECQVITLTDPETRHAPTAPLATSPTPEDLAYVIFTSGSTGQPKGVAIDHRGAANTIQDINSRFHVGPGDRVLALSALSFDLSVYDVFGVLAAGGTVVMPSAEKANDPAHWSELAVTRGITVWNSVPALMQAWVDAPEPTAESALRLVLLSGDWVPVDLPDAIRARHPQSQVVSLGGATEASIWSVCYPVGEVPPEWTRIPYGKPLANQTLHVYDELLQPCPVWTVGEIYIGGIGVATGYWADPDRTAERFVLEPRTGERLYRTGDLGRYLPGGDIEFLGREDFQVKINGYRIELGEVAASLRRQPGVGDALVGVDTNPRTGRRQLVAHVLPGDGHITADPAAQRHTDQAARVGEDELRRAMDRLADELVTYQELGRATEVLGPLVMARTLARLGVFSEAGEATSAERIVRRCGVKPQYESLIGRWLQTLEAQGWLRSDGTVGEYVCDQAFDAQALDARVQEGLVAVDVGGVHRTMVDYFARCAHHQVETLRGEVSPLELLLPEGSDQVTRALYAENPVSRVQNEVAAHVVRSVVDELPADRPARILEVGAGTGATSAEVLAALPTDRVRYRFTDVSTFFTERAKQEFSSYTFAEYGIFDIDFPPTAQDVAPGSAEIVVAANVLHDAKDLKQSLAHLRSVLAPGGTLVLVESTVNTPFQAVTVNLIEGFTHHRDRNELPLLSVAQWQEQLREAGFTGFASIPAEGCGIEVMDQKVLLAQAPAEGTHLEPGRLSAALEEELPGYLVPQHYLFIDRVPLTANGKVDRSALPKPWDDATGGEVVAPRDDMERQLLDIFAAVLEREDFGVEDNYFELGGDSLHAVRILGRLREELGFDQGADEGLQILFDNPTIAEFAQALRSQEA